ncbi:MAG TPA: hypothetical protein VHX40_07995, partial [Acidimicrobiales bacterium]|nr:hypothetical protein [Acidimicrobiales bacterium]
MSFPHRSSRHRPPNRSRNRSSASRPDAHQVDGSRPGRRAGRSARHARWWLLAGAAGAVVLAGCSSGGGASPLPKTTT